ncbi:hypothetical protein L228DRAFT_241135 [Xylona heveae TC161]|uniref:Uncharacterized protein n=1 Tax=Xylona heveae (strain CBS 132557 / TC161) TaxID=1328760 RepID=A0A165A432_XYLHT|nr:hypothetical protein L228DRAFT_241135 [Xylona heveae TC161]KZF19923.1 hypothetical protein L228DRAFT_241135 [Xylona heveae TC161]
MPDWTPPIPRPTSALAFSSLMADILRLPEETLAMSFIYINKYQRFCNSINQENDMHVPILDPHTLSLASLNLASKTTEATRRLREFLLPAWRLLHAHEVPVKPLTFPSPLYDSVRATVVQAELILLRVLQFDLRVSLPLHFVPRYLDRTVGEVNIPSGPWQSCLDGPYEAIGQEYRDEYRMVDLMETAVARACTARAVDACRSYHLSNFFPARTIAAACIYTTLEERGLQPVVPIQPPASPVSGSNDPSPLKSSLSSTLPSPSVEAHRDQDGRQAVVEHFDQGVNRDQQEKQQESPETQHQRHEQHTAALSTWLDSVTGGKVHVEDFVECISELRKLVQDTIVKISTAIQTPT